jgi:hypothetical protein
VTSGARRPAVAPARSASGRGVDRLHGSVSQPGEAVALGLALGLALLLARLLALALLVVVVADDPDTRTERAVAQVLRGLLEGAVPAAFATATAALATAALATSSSSSSSAAAAGTASAAPAASLAAATA